MIETNSCMDYFNCKHYFMVAPYFKNLGTIKHKGYFVEEVLKQNLIFEAYKDCYLMVIAIDKEQKHAYKDYFVELNKVDILLVEEHHKDRKYCTY